MDTADSMDKNNNISIPKKIINLYISNTLNPLLTKFLLTRGKFMPIMHLRQPAALDKFGFTYSACGPLTKN